MASFYDLVARQQAREAAAFQTPPSQSLPTDYSQLAVPQGQMVDADTLQDPQETNRFYGVNAAELRDKKTKQLIPAGQEAYARAAEVFQQYPNAQKVRKGQDYYGRTVSDYVTPEGQSINGELVRRGIVPNANYNRAPQTPFGMESYARSAETMPVSEEAQAIAAYQGIEPARGTPYSNILDPKYRTAGEALQSSLQRGAQTLKGGAYGTLSAVGHLLADDANGRNPRGVDERKQTIRDRITNWLQRTGEAGYLRSQGQIENLPKIGTLDDVMEGKVNALQWGLETVGEAVPSTLAMLGTALLTGATGGAAGVVGLGARTAGAAALRGVAARAGMATSAEAMLAQQGLATSERILINAARRKMLAANTPFSAPALHKAATEVVQNSNAWLAKLYARKAAPYGAFLGSATLESGHIYQDTKQAYGYDQVSPGLSLAGGALAGLLDTVALGVMLKPLAVLTGGEGPARGILKEAVKRLGIGMMTEGSTEALQELIAVTTQELQNPDQSVPLLDRITAPENQTRYLEAGVAGMLFGGLFGGMGGAVSGAASHFNRETPPSTPPTPTSTNPGTPSSTTGTPVDPNLPTTSPNAPTDPAAAGAPASSPIPTPTGAPSTNGSAAGGINPEIHAQALNALQRAPDDQLNAVLTDREQQLANPNLSDEERVMHQSWAKAAQDLLIERTQGATNGQETLPTETQTEAPVNPNTIQLRRGESVELTPTDPNAPVRRSATTAEENARLQEFMGERRPRTAAPVAPKPPAEVIQQASRLPANQLPSILHVADPEAQREMLESLTEDQVRDILEGKVQYDLESGPLKDFVDKGPGWGAKPDWLTDNMYDRLKGRNLRHWAEAWNWKENGQPVLSDKVKQALKQVMRPSLWEALNTLASRLPAERDPGLHASAIARDLADVQGRKRESGQRWPDTWFQGEELPDVAPTATPEAPPAPPATPYEAPPPAPILLGGERQAPEPFQTQEEAGLSPENVEQFQRNQQRLGQLPTSEPATPQTPVTPSPSFEIVSSKGSYDALAMRGNNGQAHMENTRPGQPGWLGNPVKWSGNGGAKGVTVGQAIEEFKRRFLAKIAVDPEFKTAVLALRGKKIGYYRPDQPNHVQVIQEWLAQQPVEAEKPPAEKPPAEKPPAEKPPAEKPPVAQPSASTAQEVQGRQRLQQTLSLWAKAFGLPEIQLTTDLAALGNPKLPPGARGFAVPSTTPGGKILIWLRPDVAAAAAPLSETATPEEQQRFVGALFTTAHELGHHLLNFHLDTAPEIIKNQLDKAYQAWLEKVEAKTPKEILKSRKQAYSAESSQADITAEYAKNKTEWLADQIAGVILRDKRVLNFYREQNQPLVLRWIRKLAQLFTDLFDALQRAANIRVNGKPLVAYRNPNEAVANFVLDVAKRQRTRWAETQGWDTGITARIQMLPNLLGEPGYQDELRALNEALQSPTISPEARAIYQRWLRRIGRMESAQKRNARQEFLEANEKAQTFGLSAFGLQQVQLDRLENLTAPQRQELDDLLGQSTPANAVQRGWLNTLIEELATAEPSAELYTRLREQALAQLEQELGSLDNFGVADYGSLDQTEQTESQRVALARFAQFDSLLHYFVHTEEGKKAWKDWREAPRPTLSQDDATQLTLWQAAFGLSGKIPVVPTPLNQETGEIAHPFAGYDERRSNWVQSTLNYFDSATLPEAFADFLVNNQWFSSLPAALRDQLVGAYFAKERTESPLQWYAQEITKALKTDVLLQQVLVSQSTLLSPRTQALINERFSQALAAKPEDRADPTIATALQQLLANTLSKDVLEKAKRLVSEDLSQVQGPASVFYKLRQGYRQQGGRAVFDKKLREQTKLFFNSLRATNMGEIVKLPEGLQQQEFAAMVKEQMDPELWDTVFTAYQSVVGQVSEAQFLDALFTVRNAVEAQEESGAMFANEDLIDEADFEATEIDEADSAAALRYSNAAPTVKATLEKYEQALPLYLTYLAGDSTRNAKDRLRRDDTYVHMEAVELPQEERDDIGSRLNAQNIQSIQAADVRMLKGKSPVIELDYSNPLFKALPVAVQHNLIVRQLAMNQAGLQVKYRLAEFKRRNGDPLIYIHETSYPSGDQTIASKDGVDRLVVDELLAKVEERRRRAHRYTETSKRNSGLKFSVGVSLQHPLLSRVQNALEKLFTEQGLTANELRRSGKLKDQLFIKQLASTLYKALENNPWFDNSQQMLGHQLLAAMGYDNAVFFGGKPKSRRTGKPLEAMSQKARDWHQQHPEEIVTDSRGIVFPAPEIYQELGYITKGTPQLKIRNNQIEILELFLRSYIRYHQGGMSHLSTGATLELTADDVVSIGYLAMRGEERVVGEYQDHLAAFVQGLRILRERLPMPLQALPAPVYTRQQEVDLGGGKKSVQWVDKAKNSVDLSRIDFDRLQELENTPEMAAVQNWVLRFSHKAGEADVTIGSVLKAREETQTKLGQIAKHQNRAEAALVELARIEQEYEAQRRQHPRLKRDATDDFGNLVSPLLDAVHQAQRQLIRFRSSMKAARNLKDEVGALYEARAFAVDDLQLSPSLQAFVERLGLQERQGEASKGDVSQFGIEQESEADMEAKVGRSPRELDRLGGERPGQTLGKMPGREVSTPSQLVRSLDAVRQPSTRPAGRAPFATARGSRADKGPAAPFESTPDLRRNSVEMQKNDRDVQARSPEKPDPAAEVLKEKRPASPWPGPQDPVAVAMERAAQDMARTLGLDMSQVDLHVIAPELASSLSFDNLMKMLNLEHWADVIHFGTEGFSDPFFTIFKDGRAQVFLINQGNLSTEELRVKLAHELGHVFFRTYLSDLEKQGGPAWAKLTELAGSTDVVRVEEWLAREMEKQLTQKTEPRKTLVQKIITYLRTQLTKLYKTLTGQGSKEQQTEALIKGLLNTVKYRAELAKQGQLAAKQKWANPFDAFFANQAPDFSDAARFYAGQRLLENTTGGQWLTRFGKSLWEYARSFSGSVLRTLDGSLRAQVNAKGEPIKAFTTLADLIVREAGTAATDVTYGNADFSIKDRERGYNESLQLARQRITAEKAGLLAETFKDITAEQQADLMERYIAANGNYQTADLQALDRLFKDLHGYYSPVLNSHAVTSPLPRIWNREFLTQQKDRFLTTLKNHGWKDVAAEETYNRLVTVASHYKGEDFSFFAPHLDHAKDTDKLNAIPDAELLPFLRVATEPEATLKDYIHQLVKRVEFERRFADWVVIPAYSSADFSVDTMPEIANPNEIKPQIKNGKVYRYVERPKRNGRGTEKLTVIWDQTARFRVLRNQAAQEGATQQQQALMVKAMDAILGRIGADFDPNLRTASSFLLAGLNWAMLPLSLTAQFTDPAMVMLRMNGDMKGAWSGMMEAIRQMRTKGDLYQIAAANGITATHLRGYFGTSYLDTPFMDTAAQKLNDKLFKWNGMEWATDVTRLFAMIQGMEWFKRLAEKGDAESKTLLAQLELTDTQVKAWMAATNGGSLQTQGMSPQQREATDPIQKALNRFVAETIFRPDATQRPLWASHPAAMLVWHLKSYLWSFAHVTLGRLWREIQRAPTPGRKALLLALPWLMMMPLAMLGMAVRDELRDGVTALLGGTPASQKDLTTEEYLAKVVSRTGVLGPLQLLFDADRSAEYGSPIYTTLLGPMATTLDGIIRRQGSAESDDQVKTLLDNLLRVSPVLGSFPEQRRGLLEGL